LASECPARRGRFPRGRLELLLGHVSGIESGA
jgi:hypothetical protein